MSNRELKQLLKLLRAQGVVCFEHNGLKIVLDPHFKATPDQAPKHIPGELAADLRKAAPGFLGMSDEQILQWSSSTSEGV